jgi:hypothetical protein
MTAWVLRTAADKQRDQGADGGESIHPATMHLATPARLRQPAICGRPVVPSTAP